MSPDASQTLPPDPERLTLQESQASYQAFLNSPLDCVFLCDLAGRFLDANAATLELLGCTLEEFKTLDFTSVTSGADLQRAFEALSELVNTGRLRAPAEVKLRRKDGSHVWVEAAGSLLDSGDGRPTSFLGIARNVTARRETEEALQASEERLLRQQARLRRLASELSSVEERERRQIGADLHDRVTQSLVALKLRLELAREQCAQTRARCPVAEARCSEVECSSTPVHVVLDDALAQIDEIVDETRSMTFELCPPTLYDFGLDAALSWLVAGFRRQHGLATTLEVAPDLPSPPEDVRIVLFRATQELLVNVAKHARARSVRVSLLGDARQIEVAVQDDGVGFDPRGDTNRWHMHRGFGLFSIRERLSLLGGALRIVSAPGGGGSKLRLLVPLGTDDQREEGAA